MSAFCQSGNRRAATQNCSTSITGVTRKSLNSVQDFAALVTSDSSALSTSTKTTSAFLPTQAPWNLTPGLRLGPRCSKSWTALSLLPGLIENSTMNFMMHLVLSRNEFQADVIGQRTLYAFRSSAGRRCYG